MGNELSFLPVPVPKGTAAEKQLVPPPALLVDGAQHKISYQLLLRAGQVLGSATFGRIMDENGKPVPQSPEDGGEIISYAMGFSSIIPAQDGLRMLTNFSDLPGAIYQTRLSQSPDGTLAAVATQAMDLRALRGIWQPGSGTVTPWQTHLASERHSPDARSFEEAASADDVDNSVKEMGRYFGLDPDGASLEQLRAKINPYRYGFPVEMWFGKKGAPGPVRHYAMGRASPDISIVMPDRRTVYISDDASNGGLYRFVADKPNDLRAGQLYALGWQQQNEEFYGSATLDWIDLGHADEAAIAKAIDGGIRFSDMFDAAPMSGSGGCPEGFGPSNAGERPECLRVKPGMEVLASRLETRRLASLLGAATELRALNGMVFNPQRNSIYLAFGEVAKGMTNGGKQDFGGRNFIRTRKNRCGAIFEMMLGEAFVAKTVRPIYYGTPEKADGKGCNINNIANPGNLAYVPGRFLLLIADAGDGHDNNFLWAVDIRKNQLIRILSAPAGASLGAVRLYPNLGGHGYVTVAAYDNKGKEKAASVGVLGPLPVLGP